MAPSWGWCLRIPLVFDFQGSLTSEMLDHRFLHDAHPMLQPLRRLECRIDRRPAVILANSQHSASLLTGQFGVAPSRILVVPDCVDTDRFHPPEAYQNMEAVQWKAHWEIPPDAQVIVYLGLLASYQGIELLLQAIQWLGSQANIHLLIMGFPNVERYRRLSHELGVSMLVTFTGAIRYQDAHRMLALGDIAVGPKISETEGSGKLLNYMAMGLPTVAFDTPVSREYLGDAGALVPLGNVEALAVELMSLARNPAERASRGEMLRRRAEECFHCSRALDAIEMAYTRVNVEKPRRVDHA